MKNLILALLLAGFSSYLNACDICGLSGSSNYFGILPNPHWNFAGFRYQYRSFHSSHSSLLGENGKIESDEFYNTTQVWGRYTPIENLQVYAFIPYNHFNKNENGKRSTLSGLGDISLLVNLLVLNTSDNKSSIFKHILQVGAGIKLPSGKSNLSGTDQEINSNFQSGTGSFDFPVNLIYTLAYKKTGINTEFTYQFNTANKQGYKFGNRLSSSMSFYYQTAFKKTNILPSIGLNFEESEINTKDYVIQLYTGGQALYTNIACEISINSFSLGVNYQHPIWQNIGGNTITANDRISTSLIYLF